ncbi:CSC1-like protein At3g54510 isoform X1 [Solanum dulcamara]|uniref:CSC1-like protein At3g54510 isoform X1 n=1 Tax=Solanum dulcamara TaxID=45834 RepID=UPI002485E550|nr:CSC1-like protein At3g54510 isoform X1 [Solanum dulcamara]
MTGSLCMVFTSISPYRPRFHGYATELFGSLSHILVYFLVCNKNEKTKRKIKMKLESVVVSAAINIGLAILILSLFALLKKQPFYSPIYYARQLSLGHRNLPDSDDHRSFSFRRLLPEVDWIFRAVRVTEEEILENCGLDVLVLVRLFKFGIRFFLLCSIVGLLVLLPLNYTGSTGPNTSSDSMDAFTISNISRGSDRLWVHFSFLCFVSCYGMYLLYKEYNHIFIKRIQQICYRRREPEQFTILVREIPLCNEHKIRGCNVDHFFSKHHPYSYQSFEILYDGKHLDKLLCQAKSLAKKIEDLRHLSSTKKHSKYDAKIEQLEDMLQILGREIRRVQCRMTIEQKELPVAFVTFSSRWGTVLAAQSQQHTNPLLWITEMAPEPRDVIWQNLAIQYRHLPLYRIVILVAASLLTIFFVLPVTAVQGIAKYDRLKKWFPPAMAVDLIPGLRSIVTGYLPSAILNGFIYIVPFAMIGLARLAGYISRSKKDLNACNMVFYFLVGNVFFLSLLSGSLLDQIGESFSHPKDIPNRLASAVSAQADFFVTYILTNGLAGFSLEILQPGLLLWDTLKSYTWDRGKKKHPYVYSLPYYRIVPFVSLCMLIGIVYAVVSPLLLPFLVGYFLLGYAVFINQIEDVYITTYETCGLYWPYIHHYIIVAIILMQVTMIGLFGLKAKPSASFSVIPLLVVTILFNEYCKIRFLPTFNQVSVQDAKNNDELDKKDGLEEENVRKALDAYSPPCLRPLDLGLEGTSSTKPFLSPT